MMRRFIFILLLAFTTGVAAQLRTIPQDAKRGEMRLVDTLVEIDGERRSLSPGIMIRDPDNLIVLPGHLPAAAPIKYRLGPDGQVRFIWLLTPAEAEASAPPSPFPK